MPASPVLNKHYILEWRSVFVAPLKGLLNPEFANQEFYKAKQHSAAYSNVLLGDIDTPIIDAPAMVQISAANLGGRFGWKGRWIATCGPIDRKGNQQGPCYGAEMVDWQLPLFMCCSCFNRDYDYQWRTLALPSRQERVQIERLLIKRPQARIHTWLPHESIQDLIDQNREIGLD